MSDEAEGGARILQFPPRVSDAEWAEVARGMETLKERLAESAARRAWERREMLDEIRATLQADLIHAGLLDPGARALFERLEAAQRYEAVDPHNQTPQPQVDAAATLVECLVVGQFEKCSVMRVRRGPSSASR